MAASLTLGTVTLGADGRTGTASISGGSGSGYTITNAAGLIVKKTNGTLCRIKVASASVSGSTLTFVLDTPAGSGQILTLDVLATSTLTDSAGNTAQGQSALSITNTSTRTLTEFAYNAPGINFAGQWAGPSTGDDGHSYYGAATASCSNEINVSITATDAAIDLYHGQSVTVTVDGGTPVVRSAPAEATGFYLVNLFAGLSDAAHNVRIVLPQFLASDVALTASRPSAAPSLAVSAGFASQLVLKNAPTSTSVATEGAKVETNLGGYDCLSWQGSAAMRFAAQCGTIRAFLYGQPKMRLWVDGVAQSIVTVGTSSAGWNLAQIATGLDSTQVHEYVIELVTLTGVFTNQHYVYSLMLDGAGLAAVAHPVLETWAWLGDSITQGSSSNMTSQAEVHPYLICKALGVGVVNAGIQGERVSPTMRDSTARITGRREKPSVIWINAGTNDTPFNFNIPVATFQADYITMLRNIRANVPATTRMYCETLLSSNGNSGSPTTYNQAIANAVAAIRADSSVPGYLSVFFVDTSSWGTGSWDVHPNAAQQLVLVNRQTPYMLPQGYSVARSATSGAPGSAITLTYTRGGGTTWNAGESVVSSDGSDGTFGAFTFTSGQSTATRTYTPGSTGTKTLTHTNAQGWLEPAAQGYLSANPFLPRPARRVGMRAFGAGIRR